MANTYSREGQWPIPTAGKVSGNTYSREGQWPIPTAGKVSGNNNSREGQWPIPTAGKVSVQYLFLLSPKENGHPTLAFFHTRLILNSFSDSSE